MSLLSQFLKWLRNKLKAVPLLVLLWRSLKRSAVIARYYILRFVGCAAYPILGCRAPLRGYYLHTLEYLKQTETLIGLSGSLRTPVAVPVDPGFEMFVGSIPNGRSLFDYGVVVSPDHRLLSDVSWEGYGQISQPFNHPAMQLFYLPPIRHIAGRVAVISSLSPNNYYHWMFDILPRFGLLQRSGLVPDYYLINDQTQFQKDSLERLEIPLDKVLNPRTWTHVEADELIVPSLLGPPFQNTPQIQACRYLRSIFVPKCTARKAHRALYISRADAKSRRVANEIEIQEELLANGFEVVCLTDVPLFQQIEMFAEARIVVGPHGAGLTNVVFSEPGSVLIEFVPEGWKIDCFEILARNVELKYRSIICAESNVSPFQSRLNDHFVDRTVLRQLIRPYV